MGSAEEDTVCVRSGSATSRVSSPEGFVAIWRANRRARYASQRIGPSLVLVHSSSVARNVWEQVCAAEPEPLSPLTVTGTMAEPRGTRLVYTRRRNRETRWVWWGACLYR